MLLGFTGFYRVLPGFTGFYLVMPSLGRKERGQGVILVNERDSDGANDCDNNGGIKRKRRRAVAASRTGRRGAGAGRRPTFFFRWHHQLGRSFLSLSLSLSLRRAGAVATFGRSQTWKRPFRPAGPLGLIVVREEMERGEPDCRLSTPLYLMERGKLDRSTAQSQSETDSSVAGLVVFFFGLVF